MEKLEEAEQTAIERATAQFRPQALANTTTRQSSLSALENMHYSQMIRFDNAEEASMLKSLLNIYDLDCGGWWVALGIASSIGLEPKNVKEVIQDESWTMAMQEELNQFKTNDVWILVPPPDNQTIINFDETYAPVARLECMRILLAYACEHDFKLFQMDVKSAFLNGFINKEVYVTQPPDFVHFEKPNHVFKLKKTLYGLKQAPKAWYDILKAFLLDHMYTMGLVDNTLFTQKKDSRIIIVQIYVDDIIFGSTCQDLCGDFSKIMHDEFEMSMMGELNFFLGLQIKQQEDIFFNQSKYIKEMLNKFGLEDSKPIKTPMSSDIKLTRDEDEESVDDTKYRDMIGSLLYLTASRQDIMFSVFYAPVFKKLPKPPI
ncbi:retrovirus-related pol polyprotein from transposon TNT 1-94 [Tanacetum coccineum]